MNTRPKTPRLCTFPEHRRRWKRLLKPQAECPCCLYGQAEGIFDLTLARFVNYPPLLEQVIVFWEGVNWEPVVIGSNPFEPCWMHRNEWAHWDGKPLPAPSLAYQLVWGCHAIGSDLYHYGPNVNAGRCCNPFHMVSAAEQQHSLQQMQPAAVLGVQSVSLDAQDQLDDLLAFLEPAQELLSQE
jgi:hypothetical protein